MMMIAATRFLLSIILVGLSFQALLSVPFEMVIKEKQAAQFLRMMCAIGLGYLATSFLISMIQIITQIPEYFVN